MLSNEYDRKCLPRPGNYFILGYSSSVLYLIQCPTANSGQCLQNILNVRHVTGNDKDFLR
jgi:hypothetical protein